MTSPRGPAGSFELWLLRNAQGWSSRLKSSGNDGVETIPLTHRTTVASPVTFTASIHATAAEVAHSRSVGDLMRGARTSALMRCRRGRHGRRVSGRGTSRQPETDTTEFARGTTLSERNESALVLPDAHASQCCTGRALALRTKTTRG